MSKINIKKKTLTEIVHQLVLDVSLLKVLVLKESTVKETVVCPHCEGIIMGAYWRSYNEN